MQNTHTHTHTRTHRHHARMFTTLVTMANANRLHVAVNTILLPMPPRHIHLIQPLLQKFLITLTQKDKSRSKTFFYENLSDTVIRLITTSRMATNRQIIRCDSQTAYILWNKRQKFASVKWHSKLRAQNHHDIKVKGSIFTSNFKYYIVTHYT